MTTELKRPDGFEKGESLAVEWYTVPRGPGRHPSAWDDVCFLRITTPDGIRVIRRDRISGVSRLPTGGLHREPSKVAGLADKETPIFTTVVIYDGQAVALGGTRNGTSGALHRAIEFAWLGDGFDGPHTGPLTGADGPAIKAYRYALKEVSEHKAGYRHSGATEAVDALAGIERMLNEQIKKELGR